MLEERASLLPAHMYSWKSALAIKAESAPSVGDPVARATCDRKQRRQMVVVGLGVVGSWRGVMVS